jgi:hypothetical protein
VDQLAEAHRVLLFGGKGTEVHPAFWISFRACVGLHLCTTLWARVPWLGQLRRSSLLGITFLSEDKC